MGERINITYETLFDILRNEKRREELQKLEPEFYQHLVEYIKEKELLAKDESGSDIFSGAEKLKAAKQLENIRKLVRELYERREKKIISMSMIQSRTGSLLDKTALLKDERAFFDEITDLLSKHRRALLVCVLSAEMPKPKSKEQKPKVDNSECSSTKLVRFLKPVPKFVGKELEVYGPFEEEDVANLPVEIAELLINKSKAEELKS